MLVRHPEAVGGQYAGKVVGVGGGEGSAQEAPFVTLHAGNASEILWDVLGCVSTNVLKDYWRWVV